LALFAIALFLEVDASASLQDFLTVATAKINTAQPLLMTDLPGTIERDHQVIDRIRSTTIILSAISITLAIFIGIKYELMDS